MEPKSFRISLNEVMNTTFNFTEDGKINYKMGMKTIETDIASLRTVEIKASKLHGSRIVRIQHEKGGKIKKFARLDSDPSEEATNQFLDALKEYAPHVEWTDGTSAKAVKKEGDQNVYDLQVYFFWYAGAGLPRGVQIWLIWGIFSLLIIPLPWFIYILVKKGYRMKTDEEGITIRTIGERRYNWDDIERLDMINVDVAMYNEGFYTQTVKVVKFVLRFKNGASKSFRMRTLEAQPFIQEMAERGMLGAEYDKDAFVV